MLDSDNEIFGTFNNYSCINNILNNEGTRFSCQYVSLGETLKEIRKTKTSQVFT